MKTYKFNEKTEFPYDSTIWDELQNDIKAIESTLVSVFGTGHFIVSGCVIDADTISEGYMLSGGVLYRFEGGTYYDPGIITFPTRTSSVEVNSTTYNRWSEKVASMYSAPVPSQGEVAFSSFKNLGDVILTNHYFSKSFNADVLTGVTGISERYGRVVYSPYFVDVKIRFKVNTSIMSQQELDEVISITGFDGGTYDIVDNKAGWIGTYKLTHNSMSAVAGMYLGNVRLHQSANHTLQLYKPHGDNYNPAASPVTYNDLFLINQAQQAYYIEIEARLTRSSVIL